MNNHCYRKASYLLTAVILGMSGCKTHKGVNGTAIDQMNTGLYLAAQNNQRLETPKKRLPSRISNALIPKGRYHRSAGHQFAQRRFDISVKSVPANTFFMGLVKGTPISIAVSPDVVGNITLNLKNVTVKEVLQTLEDVYGYTYRETASGYQVLGNKVKTKIYSVNYLDVDRQGNSQIQISSGQVSQGAQNNQGGGGAGGAGGAGGGGAGGNQRGGISSNIGRVQTQSKIDFWKELEATLTSMVGSEGGRSITVNPHAGIVVARALPAELKQIEYYLDAVQNSMDRQVVLEAKILEVALNHNYQMGIDWRLFGANLRSLSTFPNSNITDANFADAYNINIRWNPTNFTTTIRALSEQGNIQVLSSPRVSTLNNQKAVIKVGSDDFYVTSVTSTPVQAGLATVPQQDVELTPFFSGITLDVTPQIDARGNVTLHIHPAISSVKNKQTRISLNSSSSLDLPLASSTIRESDTVVHAKDGQVIVIGGLMQNLTQEDLAGMPFLANMPFLGTLFKNTKQHSKKSELVILLKPTVVKKQTWTNHAIDAQQRINGLKRGFHVGGYPDVFGTEGEKPQKLGAVAGQFGRPRVRGR